MVDKGSEYITREKVKARILAMILDSRAYRNKNNYTELKWILKK